MTIKRWYLPVILPLLVALLVGCGSTPVATESPTASPPTATTQVNPEVSPPVPASQATPSAAAMVRTAMEHVQRYDGQALAIVNGAKITWEDYEPALRQAIYSVTRQYNVNWADPATQERLGSLQNDVLKQTVDRWLLTQMAEEQGIAIDEAELTNTVENEKTRILDTGIYPDWNTFLETNGFTDDSFRTMLHDTMLLNALLAAQQVDPMAEQVHIAHIVVGDEAAGQEVLSLLQAGEDFAALAKQYSKDPNSAPNGGDLGWFSRQVMDPSIAGVAFSMQVGTFSDLIGTPQGYAIIELIDKQVRELDQQGMMQKQQEAVMAQLEAVRAQADIEFLVDFLGN